MQTDRRKRSASVGLAALALGISLAATGCQVSVNGQTLPSPYYLSDDLRYDAPGPEMKLMREAAAQRQFAEEQAALAE